VQAGVVYVSVMVHPRTVPHQECVVLLNTREATGKSQHRATHEPQQSLRDPA
jgi:histone acetyltransferase (RNA polymerase elongator complex component)